MSLGHRAVLLVPVLLLLAACAPVSGTTGLASSPSAPSVGSTPGPTVATTPSGNLSIPLDLGNSSLAAGTHLVSTYQFQVVSWPKGLTNLTVWVGSVQVSFPESSGSTFDETIPALNLTLTSGALSNANATVANDSVPKGGLTFGAGSVATLSSQLLAVMVSVSWGTVKMSFHWHWESVPSTGASNYSAWSAFQTFTPPEHLIVVSDGPAQISPGQAFNVCIGGSIQSRTFSLHMEVANPYYSFAWNTTNIPANETGTYCWSDTMPKSFTKLPAALLVHIWEYATLPSILAILHTSGVALNGGTVRGKISPSSASAQLGSTVLTLTAGSYNVVVATGTYTLSASATGYQAGQVSVKVVANQTRWANLSLTPMTGTLAGNVTPSRAQVSVNGTSLMVNSSSGSFLDSLAPGSYIVYAKASGYAPENSSVTIVSNTTTRDAIDLYRLTGWLAGAVTPANASLTVNGTAVPLGAGGTFNVTLATGTYSVRAALPGYTVWASSLSIGWNSTTNISIVLEPGWIVGTVTPATASLSLNGVEVALAASTGAFNVSELGGPVWVEASDPGYLLLSENLTVVPGQTIVLVLMLNDTATVKGVVLPAGSILLWDGQTVPVSGSGSWNVTTTSGSHWLNASDAGFASQDLPVLLSAGEVDWQNLTLLSLYGVLLGTVTPAFANLTLNGADVQLNATTGEFNVSELGGPVWVDASASGYLPFNESVTVVARLAFYVNITLNDSATVEGVLLPANATLLWQNRSVPVDAAGDWSVTTTSGSAWLNASAAGYAFQSRLVVLQAGEVEWENLSLISLTGLIEGSVTPVGASLALNGTSVPLDDRGGFSIRELPGTYSLNVSLADHTPTVRSVSVDAGAVSWVNFSLLWSVGWVDGTILPGNGSITDAGSPVATLSGNFNVTLPAGTYLWSAREVGFQAWNGSVVVVAGRSTSLRILLSPLEQSTLPPVPVPPVRSPPIVAHPAATGVEFGTTEYLLLLALGAAIVLVVALATRRGRRPVSFPSA